LSLQQLKSIFQEQASDRADDFVTQTPTHFNSSSPIFDSLETTSVLNFTTDTNSEPAFPSSYSPLHTLTGGEFKRSLGDSLKNHGWFDLYQRNHKSISIGQPSPRSENPYQPFSYGNPNVGQNLDIKTSGFFRSSVISAVGNTISSLNFFNSNLIGGLGDFLSDLGQEPYIVSSLPRTDDFGINGRLINSGHRLAPLARPLTDTLRIAKYLSSPAGLLAIAARNISAVVPTTVVKSGNNLIRLPQRFNTGYNPLSTLASTGLRVLGQGLPNRLVKSGFTGEYGKAFSLEGQGLIPSELTSAASNFISDVGKDLFGDLPTSSDRFNTTFIGASNNIDFSEIKLTESQDSNIIGAKVKKHSSGDKLTLSAMIKGDSLRVEMDSTTGMFSGDKVSSDPIEVPVIKKNPQTGEPEDTGKKQTIEQPHILSVNIEAEKNGLPIYFKDLRDKSYIFFRGYVEGITEDIAPTWSETSYIGRSEPVYVYEGATRGITFTLKLIAQTRMELTAIYEKMNRLTSLAYPEYAKDNLLSHYLSEKKNENGEVKITKEVTKTRMKPPLTKFRLGDMFGSLNNELTGFIETISYSVPESSTWETQSKFKVPRHIMATITYRVIHDEVPGLFDEKGKTYKFYGVGGGK